MKEYNQYVLLTNVFYILSFLDRKLKENHIAVSSKKYDETALFLKRMEEKRSFKHIPTLPSAIKYVQHIIKISDKKLLFVHAEFKHAWTNEQYKLEDSKEHDFCKNCFALLLKEAEEAVDNDDEII